MTLMPAISRELARYDMINVPLIPRYPNYECVRCMIFVILVLTH